jgi:hypothetical protein
MATALQKIVKMDAVLLADPDSDQLSRDLLAYLKIAVYDLIRKEEGDGLYQSTDDIIILVAVEAMLVKATQQLRAGPDPDGRLLRRLQSRSFLNCCHIKNVATAAS